MKHGLSNHPLYHVWSSMKRRCYNKSERAYKWYGALGITICDEWLNDFTVFYNWAMTNGYEPGLSIERIKNELGYSPENCKWIKVAEQNANRTYNHKILYDGKTNTLAEWSRILGFDYMLILQRIRFGKSFEEAISYRSLTQKKPVVVINTQSKETFLFDGVTDCAKQLEVTQSAVSHAIKGKFLIGGVFSVSFSNL